MTKFKMGDVVLGAFTTKDGKVLHHYSVVLMATVDGVMLIYTTSLKSRSASAQVFSSEDMLLANWTAPCRWDASSVSLVPNTEVRKVGTITKKTMQAITAAHANARKQKAVSTSMLTTDNKVVVL